MLFNVFINGSDDEMRTSLLNLQVPLILGGLQAHLIRLEVHVLLISLRNSLRILGDTLMLLQSSIFRNLIIPKYKMEMVGWVVDLLEKKGS